MTIRTLTAREVRELLDYDPNTGFMTWRPRPGNDRVSKCFNTMHAGNIAGVANPRGYIHITIRKKTYFGHRLVWLHIYGREAIGQIDHINGDCGDNRLSNLRECTTHENKQNIKLPANNTSGYIGVTRVEYGRWQARIAIRKQRVHLGFYATASEAAMAYRDAKRKFHTFQPTIRENRLR